MDDRRRDKRSHLETSGAFLHDGIISLIRIRDKTTAGVGVFAYQQFKPGQQGVLMAKWDRAELVEELPTEVCWCMPDPMAEDKEFPFRIGLRILGI